MMMNNSFYFFSIVVIGGTITAEEAEEEVKRSRKYNGDCENKNCDKNVRADVISR